MALGSSSSEQLRLGKISYLNVLPIYYPLESGIVSHPFRITSGTPADLNQLMVRGELEVSVVSSIEYARYPERYLILPDLSISCRGPVRSVLLLSQRPFDQLSGETILVTSHSHTSVALVKILLTSQLGVEAIFRPGSCTEALAQGKPPLAMLTIGDEALRLREHSQYPYRLDLGEAWFAWTGLPFVFALWVIQRQALERCNGVLRQALDALSSAKAWGCSHRDEICLQAAERGILNVEQLTEYYQCLNYDLDRDQQRGLELYFEHLVGLCEISRVPSLQIYSSLACVA
jgi:chorismate dehydratase